MEQSTFLYLLVAFGICAIGVVGYFFRKSEKVIADLGVEKTLTKNLQHLIQTKEQKVDELTAESVEQKQEIAAATARVEEKQKDIEKRDDDLSKLRKRLDDDAAKITELETSKARIQTAAEQSEKATAEQIKHLSDLQEDMKLKFEKVVNDGLKNQSETFAKSSIAKLKVELDPLKANVDKFERELRAVNQSAKTERELLQNAIDQVNAQTKSLADEAINLTRALKGDTRQQGAWGESVLQRILETSGLRKGEEYEVQVSRKDDEGNTLRPDVIIRLPEGKTLVIDAKVSLVAYQQLINNEDLETYEAARKRNAQSIKSHISNLSSKDYTVGEERTLDYVIMFIPIEGAFAEALKCDGELTEFAINKGITIATPTTLTMALKTIASVWHVERRNKNAEEIALHAGRMHDKIAGFIASMEKVCNHIQLAGKSYENAFKQLKTGRGSLVSRAAQLKMLGATTTKAIPYDDDEIS